MQTQEILKQSGDVIAAGVTVGTITQLLPSLAAVFTVMWTAVRLYETKTVQSIFKGIGKRIKKIRKGK